MGNKIKKALEIIDGNYLPIIIAILFCLGLMYLAYGVIMEMGLFK